MGMVSFAYYTEQLNEFEGDKKKKFLDSLFEFFFGTLNVKG